MCVGSAEEHVFGVFQYSGAVRLLRGDSRSTETEAEYHKPEPETHPFKIKYEKIRKKLASLVICIYSIYIQYVIEL